MGSADARLELEAETGFHALRSLIGLVRPATGITLYRPLDFASGWRR